MDLKTSKTLKIILGIFILILFVVNYSFLDQKLEEFLSVNEKVKIERIIDGDTVEFNKTSIRLLGINTPERGEFLYEEASEFLESLILNENVSLEFGKDRYDRYKRILAYIYFNNENINLKLVELGFANYYFPSGKDIYYDEFKQAWLRCLEKEVNLCELSSEVCSKCIELNKFDSKNGEIVFYNKCSFSCELTNWEIKDEGRKKFVFPEFVLNSNKKVIVKVGEGTNSNNELFWEGEKYVWTSTGDTLFLRDDKGKLVLWESY